MVSLTVTTVHVESPANTTLDALSRPARPFLGDVAATVDPAGSTTPVQFVPFCEGTN